MVVVVYSSSGESQERSASNSSRRSPPEGSSFEDDVDYMVEGDSYSTTEKTGGDDDDNVNEVTQSFARTGLEFQREKTQELEINGSPETETINRPDVSRRRVIVSKTLRVLFNLLRAGLIVAFFVLTSYVMITAHAEYRTFIAPKFTLESVSVFPIQLDDGPVLSSSAVHHRNITANWNMIFNVGNPSESHVLSFSDMEAQVLYGKSPFRRVLPHLPVLNKIIPPRLIAQPIWKTAVPGFRQHESHRDFVKVSFDSIPVSIDNATANSLAEDINSGTSWDFSVYLSGNITQTNSTGIVHHSGRFTAHCPMNMVFLETGGGVMAASSEECMVLRSGLSGWVPHTINVAAAKVSAFQVGWAGKSAS